MFVKATKKQARLRMALAGPAGSGKTFSALAIAAALGQRVAVIDTEHGSASKYADRFAFDVCELETYSPDAYVKAIKGAEAAGYDVLVIDSLSHAWNGKGGALEMVDEIGRRSRSGNSFNAWRDVTPKHNALVEAMISSRCHIVATMRAKTEYVLEEVNGKKAPRKVGLAPVQREGMEYEFDVFGDLNPEHGLHITKTRCPDLADKYIDHPGADLGRVLRGWLSDGAPAAPSSPVLAVVPPVPEHRAIPTTQAPKALPRGGQAAPVAPTDTEANTIAGPSMAAGPGSVSSGEMAKVPAAPVQEVDDAPVLAAIEEAQDLRGLYGARFKEARVLVNPDVAQGAREAIEKRRVALEWR